MKFNVDGETSIITHHPDEDAINSLILRLRLFYRDKDKISFRLVTEYMKDLNFDNELIQRYEKGRKILNDFLDSTAVIYNNEAITYRMTIDVFFYGWYAHVPVDKKEYKTYKIWKNDTYTYEFRKTDLLGALNNILRFLFFFENWIRQELKRICV
jgi:hypothetical protein